MDTEQQQQHADAVLAALEEQPVENAFRLLVVDCGKGIDWYDMFDGRSVVVSPTECKPIAVEQAAWEDISLTTYPDASACVCVLAPAAQSRRASDRQAKQRSFKPQMVLIRNTVGNLLSVNCKHILFGFQTANIPCINSAESILLATERPWVYAALRAIEKRLGHENFPLIPATYYPTAADMIIDPGMPAVVKIGSTHAGLGKMKIDNTERWDDLKSVIAMSDEFCTAEPFIDYDIDFRIQKIGSHIRALKRQSIHWKINRGFGTLEEDTELLPEFRRWVEEASQVFGGMDICALDVVRRASDGRYFILELNDTSIGLSPRHEFEDSERIRDLVLQRITEHMVEEQQIPAPDGEVNTAAAASAADEVAALRLQLEREHAGRKHAEAQLAAIERAREEAMAAAQAGGAGYNPANCSLM